jgi:hypothetical protein
MRKVERERPWLTSRGSLVEKKVMRPFCLPLHGQLRAGWAAPGGTVENGLTKTVQSYLPIVSIRGHEDSYALENRLRRYIGMYLGSAYLHTFSCRQF